ncbi:MAG: hypothetical protein LBF12_02130, partial [Christensenellaceae bacterium]|nr:hypothetical protein [Christensenellaceae bacterium]
GNEKPKGAFTIYYQKFGTTDEWVTTTPKDIAKYNIKIEFIAASTENYTNAEAEYSGIFEIINGNLSVTLLYRQDKYQGVKVDEAKPTILKPDGKPVDFAVVKIRYRLNGAEDLEWSIATPSASGWYDVLIEVEQDESLTYIRYSNVFERILRILNPEPIFDITAYTRTYNGAAQSLPLANILLTNSITIEGGVKVNDISEELTGYISLRYSQDGNTWTSALPKNVGLYSIKIIYTEGEDDHFATIETSAYNVKYTITPMTLIVVPDSGLTKVYDAIPVSGDLITYTFANNIGPYENDTKTGTLIVGNDSKSVGSYQIGKGSLNYGSNYDVRLTATPVYFTVTKRSIAPIFEDISYVYDGTPKMPSVYINKTELAGSDVESDVNLNRVIENANINSGTFKVTVSIPGSSNYKLSDDFNPVRVYVIDDAKMTQNLFITNEKIIYYDGDKHELKLDSREPGADVKYYRILNIEDEEIEEIAGTYVEIGEYNIKAVVTKINYEKQTLYATLKIVKGKIEVNIILPEGELYYGKALPSIGTSAQGTVSLDSNQELTPGTGFYNWTFIPQDEEHYEIVNGTIELTVNKATPDIKIEGSLDQVEGSSESLEIKVYVDNIQHTVPYKTYYKDTNGTVYYSVPTAPGTYSVFIEVEGNEFIAPQTFEKEFVVARKSIIWPYILAGIAGSLFILALMFVGFRRKASVR